MTAAKTDSFISLAASVLDIEAQAVSDLKRFLDGNFNQACEYLLACKGRVIVIGMGKSGHIGGKIAATLASTGTPAFLFTLARQVMVTWA